MNTIKTTLFPEATRKAIQNILEPHGARLEIGDQACLIHFPEGTRKEQEGRGRITITTKLRCPMDLSFFRQWMRRDGQRSDFPEKKNEHEPREQRTTEYLRGARSKE